MIEETDNDFSAPRLTPMEHSFSDKNKLKRRVSEIPLSQIEYLSAAYLENDLSPDQITELEENLRNNPANRKIFEVIQKTRLSPAEVTFKYKSSLHRLTPGKKIFRMAAATLSAAATIAILVISIVYGSRKMTGKDPDAAGLVIDTLPVTFLIASNSPVRGAEIKTSTESSGTPEITLAETILTEPGEASAESVPVLREMTSSFAVKIPESAEIKVPEPMSSVLASKARSIPVITYDDRGPVRKFIAAAFRQKILREEYYTDEKLKPYEVAKAGIEGINRLLDWEMQLTENLDAGGVVNSVNFSSTLISFNAPVKKTEE